MDPLKPLGHLARLILSKTDRRKEPSQSNSTGNAAERSVTPAHFPSLEERLRSKFAASPQNDPGAARELFVEAALLNQLGEEFARDPAFYELTKTVASQLAADPHLCNRLDELLNQLRKPGV